MLVVAVVLGVLTVTALWRLADEGDDPRAYPGSDSHSLGTVLDDYGLTLPDCAQDDVRYALYLQFRSDSFYLHFRGERCIQEFLDVNGFGDEETYTLERLSFSPGDGEEFAWPSGADGQFVGLDAVLTPRDERSTMLAVEIVIDEAMRPNSLYLWAGTV